MSLGLILDLVVAGFLLAGAFFVVVGGIGVIRLPDFFSRTHGAGITDTMGATLVISGLMIEAGLSLVTLKLLLILFFLLVTSPTACHALTRAALAEGVAPQVVAPEEDASSLS
ncbi:MAG: monovalent cation/H(+) antiporter subunit G [Acidobacteriota bacterium]